MRTWSLDEVGRVCVDGNPFWWTERERANELAQFIVDACNAAERHATLNVIPYGCVSPQGHAVMEDLAKYEAMHPVHNSPEVRLTE